MQRIWGLGMNSDSISVIWDCVWCLFSFSFNRLRESSVISGRATDVSLSTDLITERLSVVKGRASSR